MRLALARLALACLAVVLVLAACASTTDAEADVGDFTEIQAGAATITPDPSGTTATLRVTTTIDAVCAVAYGPTEALGSLATDEDMAGGAHDDHAATMTGLEPETTYHYRLQGVGADGRLYRSELMTFTTPAATGSGARSERRRRRDDHGRLVRVLRWLRGRPRDRRRPRDRLVVGR